ncbi:MULTISPECIES: sucrose phosphorylase [Pseudoalteromonas]|uniref:Sucrose phosphorylase n=1 Tax=Pseudoalteromonas amylolytica TaxID=1859457 RepID=A0A1S1MSJ1_9GAMM|nr:MULTISPECIES: sucrose phosphorylase [Pseudoalteromonas]OHU86284.1 sucrose phosphorylase [Pseudoalteromonas sp. JW3]OHU89611.1 sucrose phosphorylase [Pseudoalteromonas amylolytica]
MKNQVQLITYADRLTGNGLTQLKQLLDESFCGLFSGVHILPFYYPIDGSDAGFDPIDHTQVDSRLGTWQTLSEIGQSYEVMADLIVNHVSGQSNEFQDVLQNGRHSSYWSMFLKETDVFPNGITPAQADMIFRPRPTSCFSPKKLATGEVVNFWTTFTDNQIDINVETDSGKSYLDDVLNLFAKSGVKIIRLDAAGFAIKRAGTSCFMTDETFVFIKQLAEQAHALGMETIAEIHSHYQTQIAIAKKVDRVYDFALPPLILHTLFNQNVDALVSWLNISPRNCLTVLDTHDGIGIVDAGPEGGKPGLLNASEVDSLVQTIHANSHGESLKATGSAASNVDLYQVNCTYYDALGRDDLAYLTARAIQFFSPGVPQVYYGGLLALNNDMTLLEQTQVGRDINRSYLSLEQVHKHLGKPVVKGLCKLIKLRNSSAAFNGEFSVQGAQSSLTMKWQNIDDFASLEVDLSKRVALLTTGDTHQAQTIDLADLLN